jgi:hypothetical protein
MGGMTGYLLAIGGSKYTTSAPHFSGSGVTFLQILFVMGMVIALLWYILTVGGKHRRK